MIFSDFPRASSQEGLFTMGSHSHRMKCEELRHDLYMVTFSTDYVVMMPKYHGKILVGDDRRGTGIIRKTYEDVNIGTQELCVRDNESLCTGSVLKCGVQ